MDMKMEKTWIIVWNEQNQKTNYESYITTFVHWHKITVFFS